MKAHTHTQTHTYTHTNAHKNTRHSSKIMVIIFIIKSIIAPSSIDPSDQWTHHLFISKCYPEGYKNEPSVVHVKNMVPNMLGLILRDSGDGSL